MRRYYRRHNPDQDKTGVPRGTDLRIPYNVDSLARRRRQGLTCYLDVSVRRDTLQYRIFWGKRIQLGRMSFTREGKKEEVYYPAGLLMHAALLLGYDVNMITRKELSSYWRGEVCRIFPYIRRYTGIADFRERYEKENSRYPYETYEEAKRLADLLVMNDVDDPNWRIRMGDHETLFLSACYKDSNDAFIIVVLNHSVCYTSNSQAMIRRAELISEFRLSPGEEGQRVVEFLPEVFPECRLDVYLNSGGRYLFHFVKAREDGRKVFELLAKSGLGVLADQYLLESFEGLNDSETSPGKIFGLPLKLLRYANENFGTISINSAEERILLKELWEKCPEMFRQPFRPLDTMWINLLVTADIDERFHAHLLDNLPVAKTFRYLHRLMEKNALDDYTAFVLYENYVMYSERLGLFPDGPFPDNLEEAIRKAAAQMEETEEERRKTEFETAVCREAYQELMEDLPEEEWCVCAPENVSVLFHAAHTLRNCLAQYMMRISRRIVCIGLIYRKTETGRKLAGALEIRFSGRELIQAKSFCNEKFRGKDLAYLIRYARRKKLDYSGCDDLMYMGYELVEN